MRAFVSYSWDSPDHSEWVRRFADTLICNGVDTVLDQYDLPIGGDRFKFMESAIRRADYVMCVCTPEYVSRANDREKGVGVETTLISSLFFESNRTKQFIPIIRHTEPGRPYTPDYMSALIFVDFREDTQFDRRMEELLRQLHGQPEHRKPSVGPIPDFGTSRSGMANTTPTTSKELEVVRRLITFLEDRRILFSSIWGRLGLRSRGTIPSVLEIRKRLGAELEALPRESEIADSFWNMQEACRSFLDGMDLLDANLLGSSETHALIHDFREVFRNELTRLAHVYGVSMRRLIPPAETLKHSGLPDQSAAKLMFTDGMDWLEKRSS